VKGRTHGPGTGIVRLDGTRINTRRLSNNRKCDACPHGASTPEQLIRALRSETFTACGSQMPREEDNRCGSIAWRWSS
jgi:hypothetical protein